MNISIPEHTHFFSGYMDATARVFTTESVLVSMWAEIIPDRHSFRREMQATMMGERLIQNPVRDFEKAVEAFFQEEATTCLLFYLVEYWMWFKEYSNACTCFELDIEFDIPVLKKRVFALELNGDYTVLVVLMAIAKKDEDEKA